MTNFSSLSLSRPRKTSVEFRRPAGGDEVAVSGAEHSSGQQSGGHQMRRSGGHSQRRADMAWIEKLLGELQLPLYLRRDGVFFGRDPQKIVLRKTVVVGFFASILPIHAFFGNRETAGDALRCRPPQATRAAAAPSPTSPPPHPLRRRLEPPGQSASRWLAAEHFSPSHVDSWSGTMGPSKSIMIV